LLAPKIITKILIAFYRKIFPTLRNIFKSFLKMSFTKKFIITYLGCWISFLSVIMLSKVVVFLMSLFTPSHSESVVKTVEYLATKKFEVVSSSVSNYVDHNFLSSVLSYFINNSISCIVILLAYIILAYLYRKEIKPYRVYQKGVLEWIALDKLPTYAKELLWTLIYRKMKGKRGNTMLFPWEVERLISLIN